MENIKEGCYAKNFTLATEAQLKQLPPLREAYRDGFLSPDTKLWFRFFAPTGNDAVWYVVAGSPDAQRMSKYEDDWLLYGLAKIGRDGEWEWGVISLRELEAVCLPFLLRVEKTRGCRPRKVKAEFKGDLLKTWFGKDLES